MPDHITVRIPASTAHVAIVRAVASTLAARLDFTYDRITDLHIALDEVTSRIIAASHPRATRLQFTFVPASGCLRVMAGADEPFDRRERFFNPWARTILESLTESIEVSDRDGVTSVTFEVGRGARA